MSDYKPPPASRARIQFRNELIDALVEERNPTYGDDEAFWTLREAGPIDMPIVRPLVRDKERYGASEVDSNVSSRHRSQP